MEKICPTTQMELTGQFYATLPPRENQQSCPGEEFALGSSGILRDARLPNILRVSPSQLAQIPYCSSGTGKKSAKAVCPDIPHASSSACSVDPRRRLSVPTGRVEPATSTRPPHVFVRGPGCYTYQIVRSPVSFASFSFFILYLRLRFIPGI